MLFGFFKKNDPDFSSIDSNDKAVDLFNKGQLSKLYLMPLEFGGQDAPTNYLFVPQAVVDLKAQFDAQVEKLLIEGKKLGYSANPEYKGDSFIPGSLVIQVSGEVQFEETIHVW